MHDLLAAISKPFIPDWATPGEALRPFLPELLLIATIIATLLTPFAARRPHAAGAAVALAGLAAALLAALAIGSDPPLQGAHFVGMLVFDPLAAGWRALLLLFALGIAALWAATGAGRGGDAPEFLTLLLAATLGMSLMGATSNLLMLFMAMELASLPSYVLAGFRKTHRLGAEAGLKYVVFGSAASAVMLYGLSLLYGLFGTLQIESMALGSLAPGNAALAATALVAMLVGIGFKLSAVPFHFWCPDVFEGASVEVAAFLSVASKGAAVVLLTRVATLLGEGAGDFAAPMAVVLGVAGAVTATVGNVAAFVQTNIKRLLAYSSIAHAGYMLCAAALLPVAAEGATVAILIYLAVYLFMNLGAFAVAAAVANAAGDETIDAYAALGRRAPVAALAMTCCLVSLVGLPPFAGFVAKLKVMLVLGDGGGAWWWLVGVIGVNTVLSLYYYLRIVKRMYLSDGPTAPLPTSAVAGALAAACAVVLVAQLIGFGPVSRAAERLADVHRASAPVAASAHAP